MSFANEFKRAVKEIGEEIAYYRGFASLTGIAESLAELEELRDDWDQRRQRFEARGRPPSEPDDWEEDKTTRVATKERLDKIIKVAAAAEEAARAAEAEKARRQAMPPDDTPPA
ncbi:MAG TPA: hypothetical protein VHY91_19310 [Pirellulales bacterium]|jgi:hypothetical protein|nr:hypothetical protein [Pirellulales bacterium]